MVRSRSPLASFALASLLAACHADAPPTPPEVESAPSSATPEPAGDAGEDVVATASEPQVDDATPASTPVSHEQPVYPIGVESDVPPLELSFRAYTSCDDVQVHFGDTPADGPYMSFGPHSFSVVKIRPDTHAHLVRQSDKALLDTVTVTKRTKQIQVRECDEIVASQTADTNK